jgi:hypothetical protein
MVPSTIAMAMPICSPFLLLLAVWPLGTLLLIAGRVHDTDSGRRRSRAGRRANRERRPGEAEPGRRTGLARAGQAEDESYADGSVGTRARGEGRLWATGPGAGMACSQAPAAAPGPPPAAAEQARAQGNRAPKTAPRKPCPGNRAPETVPRNPHARTRAPKHGPEAQVLRQRYGGTGSRTQVQGYGCAPPLPSRGRRKRKAKKTFSQFGSALSSSRR